MLKAFFTFHFQIARFLLVVGYVSEVATDPVVDSSRILRLFPT